MLRARAVLLVLMMVTAVPVAVAQEPSPVSVSGDHTPLYAVLDKARRGEAIKTVGLGGSIISSAGASSLSASLLYKTTAWFADRYGVTSDTVNSGIGGTGSVYGALRLQRDAIAHNPDLVIIDFAVNDHLHGADNHALESIVRNLRKRQIAVIILMMTDGKGEGGQHNQVPIAQRYGVPAVSYHDPTMWRVQQGQATWKQLSADGVHPTDLGHQWAADYLRGFLDVVKAEHDALRDLPPPVYDNRMEKVVFLSGVSMRDAVAWRQGFPYNPGLGSGMLTGASGDQFHIAANVGPSACVYFIVFADSPNWGTFALFTNPPRASTGAHGTLASVFNFTVANPGTLVERCGMSTGSQVLQVVDWPPPPGHKSDVWIYGIGWSAP